MGAITYGVSGAGGFFTVDGQSVKYNSDIDAVVGFCLASSRICCETGKTCGDKVPMCSTSSSFLNAQQWYKAHTQLHTAPATEWREASGTNSLIF